MQQAIDLLEKSKVHIESLHTDMVPLSVAYRAIELSVNQQLEDTLNSITTQMEGLFENLENINEEND